MPVNAHAFDDAVWLSEGTICPAQVTGVHNPPLRVTPH
jgi:hypothetical protein